MMDIFIDTEISEVWKLSTDAARKLFEGHYVDLIGRGLAVGVLFTEI